MSDFLAIAVVRGKVMHLVDWDRPCWFLAEDPKGDRLVPDPNSILTDALLFFSYSEFDMPSDLFAGKRKTNRVFEMKDAQDSQNLDKARKILRSRKEPLILLAHFGPLDSLIKRDIAQHQNKIVTAQILE